MTTSQENAIIEVTAESTAVAKAGRYSDYSEPSKQHLLFGKWLQSRDCAILPPKETISNSSCLHYQTSTRNWPADHRASSISSAPHRRRDANCPHHASDFSFEGQSSIRSIISKIGAINKQKRSTSACSPSKVVLMALNKQSMTEKTTSGITLSSSITKSQQKIKSRIPVRIPETRLSSFTIIISSDNNSLSPSLITKQVTTRHKKSMIPLLITSCRVSSPEQTATIDNSVRVNDDHDTQEFLGCGINHDANQTLVVAFNHDNGNKNNILAEKPQKNVTCTEIIQLDKTETTEKKTANASLSIHSYGCNASPSNNQEKDCSQIMTEDKHFAQTKADTIEFQQNGMAKNDTLASHEHQFNNDSSKALMKKQAELKAYYDCFPNIDVAINDKGPDITAAQEFTKSILCNLPSGNVNDRDTLCHILHQLLSNEDQPCLFYDSENGVKLHDASKNLADINSLDRSFVLKLSSSEGLGNIKNMKSEQDDLKLVQVLTGIIERKQSHPVIEDIIERLSKVHDIDKEYIVIKTVYIGTFNVVYTVRDLASHVIRSLNEVSEKLKREFKLFLSAKIHPLLYRPTFDIAYFDKRGNKNFGNNTGIHKIGPPERSMLYTPAAGWTRYGLKTLGANPSDNLWLHPFKDPGNWYRAYHGTGHAQTSDLDHSNQSYDKQYACVDALSSIYCKGFSYARVNIHGKGVYCTPNPKFPEEGYVNTTSLDTRKGEKKFKCMLQVAVNPDGVEFTENDDVWVVRDPKDIRPYGILIKEA